MSYDKEAEGIVSAVANYLNLITRTPNAFVREMQNTHRTLQQCFTGLCISWLKACASDDYRYDGRNEASHEVAKMLLDGHEDDIYLPFI